MSCYEALNKNGLKLTRQRKMIVDIIHSRGDRLTAEDLITCIREKMPKVNKSTIYRTLDLLEKNGCIFKSESRGYFIYHHTDEKRHYHLACQNCGEITDCEEELFAPVEKALAKKYAFSVNFKHLVIQGCCEKCKNKPD